ncbi:hypothetical protein R69888_00967 [Paraburkholderia haematera]|uniref:Uncharacterized protein n=1 Tax=Paraburkholderia haematera TaxID=2793077 RepID=A0ABM8QNY6_9BURK|nr:hypothetical protein R69888_00967 [Paraburkholderia haematera]
MRPLIRQFYLTRSLAAGECGEQPTFERFLGPDGILQAVFKLL